MSLSKDPDDEIKAMCDECDLRFTIIYAVDQAVMDREPVYCYCPRCGARLSDDD